MISKIFRIERTNEKITYVKDHITKEIRHKTDKEFDGENIILYKIVLANHFEFGVRIIPIEGKLDKIIPLWFWTEKEAIPSKYMEELENKKKGIDAMHRRT